MTYILVVEDEEELRDNIAEILESEGYEVRAVASAEEALYTAFAEKPTLILCDVRMERGDGGFRVLERIRLNEPTRDTPFIFLSAAADKVTIRKGMNLGADDYITKPYTIEELLETIKFRLNRAQANQTAIVIKQNPYILIKSTGFPDKGERFELTSYLIIGRKKECNVRLTDPYVSAIACTLVLKAQTNKSIAWIHDGAIVKTPTPDTRSRYGVWVNGRKIDGQAELRGGERVELSPQTSFNYIVPTSEEKTDDTKSSEQ